MLSCSHLRPPGASEASHFTKVVIQSIRKNSEKMLILLEQLDSNSWSIIFTNPHVIFAKPTKKRISKTTTDGYLQNWNIYRFLVFQIWLWGSITYRKEDCRWEKEEMRNRQEWDKKSFWNCKKESKTAGIILRNFSSGRF